jgi:uncharacterized cupredoxin-like copper-binding protein
MKYLHHILAAALVLAAGVAMAHEGEQHASPRAYQASKVEDTPFGRKGNPRKVTRTIRVGMSDSMRFEPTDISVKKGETIRLVIENKGAVLHEMVLGTPEALKAHAQLMKRFPGMEHDEPSMAHVKPGTSGDIVWRFTKAGEFQFACLIPGHFDAGMVGTVAVR